MLPSGWESEFVAGEGLARVFFSACAFSRVAWQKALHAKTRGAYADIVMLDKQIAVYKLHGDVTIYVLGSHDNNELILAAALETIQDALEILLRGHVSRRALLENFDYVLLVIDETIDKGVLIETDAQVIATRCAMSDRPAAFTRKRREIVLFLLCCGLIISSFVCSAARADAEPDYRHCEGSDYSQFEKLKKRKRPPRVISCPPSSLTFSLTCARCAPRAPPFQTLSTCGSFWRASQRCERCSGRPLRRRVSSIRATSLAP